MTSRGVRAAVSPPTTRRWRASLVRQRRSRWFAGGQRLFCLAHWLDDALPAAEPLGDDARMTFCPRCQGPIPNDAERPTGNTVYCPHCDALLVRSADEWVEIAKPTWPTA